MRPVSRKSFGRQVWASNVRWASPLTYGQARMDVGYRLDLLVEKSVVVEVKSIDALASIHAAQVLTYLRFSGARLGYLINFNTVRLNDGFRRLVL